ncbi:hypothetical protein F0P96_20235 [Hymenobacter busanensis]|uniref:Uncharacterized protein n=1 Tax=Hymenobacter busanensis TaxID=2607656 RepID=A0A7L4ZW43_9BACT|nr:hypothetical protein [Hymenobacter busanensis]KAA9325332.1 hypothetical protein F0P96_20235 [Hymenobacter busanensis]QHJ07674.1 hypothetical protein GUY19_10400 [Hymenobacter busanensis]
MKRLFSFLLMLLGTAAATVAQKVEVKGDAILVDGAKYALIEQDGCGLMDVDCMYYLKSLDGKRLFVVKQQIFNDPAEVKASSPEGRVLYLQYLFTGSGTKAETSFPTTLHLRAIDVARKVVKAGLFANGTLNEQAAADFVTNNGNAFSERRQALNGR